MRLPRPRFTLHALMVAIALAAVVAALAAEDAGAAGLTNPAPRSGGVGHAMGGNES